MKKLVVISLILALSVVMTSCKKKNEAQVLAEKVRPSVDKGFNAYRNQQFAEAIKYWEEALSINPGLTYLFTNIGQAYYSLNNRDKALEYWMKYYEKYPEDAHINNNLGSFYKDVKQYDKAIAYYEKSIQFHSTYIMPHYNLGLIYLDTNQLELASRSVDKGLQIAPNDFRLNILRGNVYTAMNDNEKALASFRKALEESPTHPEPRTYIDEILIQKGEYDQALSDLDGVIKQAPTYPLAYYVKAKLFLAKNQELERIPELINKAIELNPADAAHYKMVLGESYLVTDKLDLAESSLQDALKGIDAGKKSLISYCKYLLGSVALKKNDSTGARTLFQEALDSDPTTKYREEIVKQLQSITP